MQIPSKVSFVIWSWILAKFIPKIAPLLYMYTCIYVYLLYIYTYIHMYRGVWDEIGYYFVNILFSFTQSVSSWSIRTNIFLTIHFPKKCFKWNLLCLKEDVLWRLPDLSKWILRWSLPLLTIHLSYTIQYIF